MLHLITDVGRGCVALRPYDRPDAALHVARNVAIATAALCADTACCSSATFRIALADGAHLEVLLRAHGAFEARQAAGGLWCVSRDARSRLE
jgi:hypothetical protein